MDHADHVRLIAPAVAGAGPDWLELGAGRGAFTLALADLLGPDRAILAVDRDATALADLPGIVSRHVPGRAIATRVADFSRPLDLAPASLDGILAANALHFVRDPAAVLAALRPALRPGGRLVVVEYDADRGNPWVPHPLSFTALAGIAAASGFTPPELLERVPSRFLGAIYGAACEPDGDRPVLHSRRHGEDREE